MSASPRFKKLSYFEYEKFKNHLKTIPREFLFPLQRIFEHIEALKMEVKEREGDIRSLKQKLGDKPQEPQVSPKPKEQVLVLTLPERIASMIDDGFQETPEFERMLKWNQITRSEAWEMAKTVNREALSAKIRDAHNRNVTKSRGSLVGDYRTLETDSPE
jgi:hypothetical protein